MKIIIIRGPLGVGKTTIATELAQQLHARYISIDEVLEKHNLDINIPSDSDGIPAELFLQVNELIKPEIDETLKVEHSIILDGCFYYLEPMDGLYKWYPETLSIFTLTAPIEICIERDVKREKAYGEEATRAVYQMVHRIRRGTEIDASGTIPETMKSILKKLNS